MSHSSQMVNQQSSGSAEEISDLRYIYWMRNCLSKRTSRKFLQHAKYIQLSNQPPGASDKNSTRVLRRGGNSWMNNWQPVLELENSVVAEMKREYNPTSQPLT